MDTTTATTSPHGAMTRAVTLALAIVTGAAVLLGLLAGAVADPAPAPAAAVPSAGVPSAGVPSAPVPPTAAPPAAVPSTHTVAPGETLADVARRHGVPTELLAADNGLADPDRIAGGQVLSVSVPPTDVIVIAAGATLSGYAQQYETTVDGLLALNPQIADPDRILAGAGLRVAQS